MIKKTREELLAQGFTEEQVSIYLNDMHTLNNEIKSVNEKMNSTNATLSEYETMKAELDSYKEKQMTAEQLLAKREKEILEKETNANKIYNLAKAKSILAGMEIDNDVLDSLVDVSEEVTVKKANALLNLINNTKVATEKSTREEIANLNVKPSASNVNQGDDGIITLEKFKKMGYTERDNFSKSNPEEFNKFLNQI